MMNLKINKSFWGKASMILLVFAMLFSASDLNAQSRKKKKKNDKSEFKDQLWYGGGFNLNFYSVNGQSIFLIGVSPMAGYKVWGPFSVGPRVGLDFIAGKEWNGAGYTNVGLFNVEPGLFARAKIYGSIFAHAETSISAQQYVTSIQGSDISKAWDRRNKNYLGLGLNQGSGAFGYDFYVLYDFELANDDQNPNLPFAFRFGFTYNF